MKILYHLIIVALSCMMVSCATQDDLKNLQEQVDKLKAGSIASIESQASSISASVAKLETVKAELSRSISALTSQAGELKAKDAEIEKLIAQLKEEMAQQISTEKGSVLAAIDSYRASIALQLAEVESSIESLQTKQEVLDGQIASLKKYIDDGLKNTKDWASSTFATLQQYNEVTATVSGIEATLAAMGKSVSALIKQCEADKKEVETKLDSLKEQFATDIESVLEHCDKAVLKLKEEVAVAFAGALEKAISELEESMKGWVNSQLTGYSTIADTESKLEQLSSMLTASLQRQIDAIAKYKMLEDNALAIAQVQSQLESNASDLQDLEGEIDALKRAVQEGYEAAISSAIKESEGRIDAKLQEALNATNKLIDEQLAPVRQQMPVLESQIATLEQEVLALRRMADELQAKIESILARVQSIVPVPSNANGQVAVANGQTEIYFEVSPRSASEALAQLGTRVFSFDAIDAKTKSITFTNIPVLSVKDNGLFLVLTVNGSVLGSSFFSGDTMMNARLKIDDGNSCVTSAYFPLCRAN